MIPFKLPQTASFGRSASRQLTKQIHILRVIKHTHTQTAKQVGSFGSMFLGSCVCFEDMLPPQDGFRMLDDAFREFCVL